MADLLKIRKLGVGMTIQDQGRIGWRRYGIPTSGPMDSYSADWANRLLGNDPKAPVLECCLQGGELEVLESCWIAHCGVRMRELDWAARFFEKGEVLSMRPPRGGQIGVWGYLAVCGGFEAKPIFGSASQYARAELGRPLIVNDILRGETGNVEQAIAQKRVHPDVQRLPITNKFVEIMVERGSGWALFSPSQQAMFFEQTWRVSTKSDRTGYRLEGANTPQLGGKIASVKSEPTIAGTVQVTTGGVPIVTMPDGPTVGGYAKLAFLEKEARETLAQCLPGTLVRLTLKENS